MVVLEKRMAETKIGIQDWNSIKELAQSANKHFVCTTQLTKFCESFSGRQCEDTRYCEDTCVGFIGTGG